MRILEPLMRRESPATEMRYSLSDYAQWVTFNGHQYSLGAMPGSNPQWPDTTFESYIQRVHNANGVVAAAVAARGFILSQLRFVWRMNDGSLQDSRSLAPLNAPKGTTRSAFLHSLELSNSYAGAAHVVRDGDRLRNLRPDHCTFLLGSDSDPKYDGSHPGHVPYDARVVALVYKPNRDAPLSPTNGEAFMADEFITWAPEPDPLHFWRGTSWVSSVMQEIVTDGQATDHTSKFFEKASTPNLVFIMDPSMPSTEVKEYAEFVNKTHAGAANAYKNLFVGGGADVKVVGSSLKDLEMKDLTGGLENRIAIRSRVPAVILGAREGLSGSSLNAGNYASARRLLADGWFAPAADSLCQALEPLFAPPRGAKELTYDRDAVLFLQEDQKDAADIRGTDAQTMRQLVDAGFDPDSVVEAVTTGDMRKLKHSGLMSVQLLPPGEGGSSDVGDEQKSSPLAATERRDELPPPSPVVVNMPAQTFNIDARQDAPLITVEPAEVNVNVPEQRTDVVVNVPDQPAPVVNVTNEAPEVRADAAPVVVNVEPTPVTVENYVETPRSKHKVKRDGKGNIIEIEEKPA